MTVQRQRRGGGISGLAIRRHIGTLMLTLAVVVLGLLSLGDLPVDLLPSVTYPRIGVRLSVPGISPEVAVDEVTRPLEEALSATEGVTQIFSQTREGRVSVDLYFEPGGDIDQALNDATAAFNRAQSRLPDAVEEPRLFKLDPSQLPVYELAIASDVLSPQALRVFADEELGRELSVVDGVAAVEVAGGLTEEVRVIVDFNRLQGVGLGLESVLDALEESNQDVAGGRLRGDLTEPLTRAVGRFQSAEEIRDLLLTGQGSQQIYLRDVAQIIDSTAEQRVRVTLNGQPAVKVSVQKQPDANTVAVIDAVKQRIEALRQSGLITEDITLIATSDESVLIQSAIANVTTAGLVGATLAGAAVFLFLGSLRQTLIIVLAIPLATLTAVVLMRLFGLSLNVFSLGGLALGVGIVVDNAIVMLEAMTGEQSTPLTMGEAVDRSQSVESALVASTATNLVAVLPFLLIGGFISLIFSELVLTISFAIAASILVAVTVVPALTARLLAVRRSSGLGDSAFVVVVNQRFETLRRGYAYALQRSLQHRVWVVLVVALLLGGSSALLLGQVP
ncbi:MAG: efflux RND transporter permease subunit, partial [Cyanobacteria bacterium P01_A01_bin.135]